jgi:low temperature requirement protein LtrA
VRRSDVLRDRGAERLAEVTTTELFFDLVYVFTFVQLSEYLYDQGRPTALDALQFAVMFGAVWWAWNYTAWATGWLDAGRRGVTVLMAVLMLLGLTMASAIPDAFADHSRALTFAGAYVVLQLLRSGVMVWAFGPGLKATMARNYAQLLGWSAIAAVPWIAGGLVHGADLRLILWAVALVLDMAAPLIGFWLPGAGATPMRTWSLAGAHLAERCHLVLIIAFGESVLRVGETFADGHGRPGVDAAFVIGFVLTVSLWAIYFSGQAEHGMARMGDADEDAAHLGRAGYTYAHALMVGGVLVTAVAIHLAIEHPVWHLSVAVAAVCIAGPLLYLLGIVVYKHSIGDSKLGPALIGIVALLVLGIPAALSVRLTELIALTMVALVLAGWAARERLPSAAQ